MRGCAWLAVALMLGTSVPAAADAVVESRKLFAEGARALEAGRARDALELFRKAYARYSHYSTLYNIGLCERALGHPVEASDALHQYLTDGDRKITAQQRDITEGLLRELEPQIASAMIRVTPAAKVTLDARAVDANVALRVNPGDHRVEAAASGFRTEQRTFTVAPGGTATLDVHLMPSTIAVTAPASESRFNALFWSMAGLSAAALATTAVTGGVALADSRAYNDPATSDAEAADHKRRGEVLRVVADVSLGVSLVSATVAILVASRKIADPPDRRAGVGFMFVAGVPSIIASTHF